MYEELREELPVVMEDGTSTTVTLFSSAKDLGRLVVICLPALGVVADYYEPLAIECSKRGWNVVTADLRGNGRSSLRPRRGVQFGYHEIVHYDLPAIVAVVKERFPTQPLFLLGHSLGGQLAALYASVNPGQADGLILVASCSVYYGGWDFPRNVGVLFATQLIRAVATVMGYFPGKRLGFGGTESAKLIKDWAHEARTGRYMVSDSSHDFEALLKTVTLPVLSISFQGDGLAPKRAVQNLYHKLNGARVTHRHFTAEDLDAPNLGHFQWVKTAGPLVRHMAEWIDTIPDLTRRQRNNCHDPS
jgi:predicted alpha/beta hydrolase